MMPLRMGILVAAILTLHLRVVVVGGYQVTLGFLLGVLYLVMGARKVPIGLILASWLPIIAITGMVALLSANPNSGDYFGTLLLFLASAFILSMASVFDWSKIDAQRHLAPGMAAALVIVTSYSAAQVLLGAMGNDSLFNPWGELQFYHPYAVHLEYVALPRAQGFYLEPSYNAFVIGSLAIGLLVVGRYQVLALTFSVVGMIVTRSATGLVIGAVLGFLLVLTARRRIALVAGSLFAGAAVIVAPVLSDRLSSISDVGSSANYRLVQPIPVLLDVLEDHPLGMRLGSVYEVIEGYGLRMFGSDVTRSLDNGVYVLIFYFGWLGVVAVGALAVWAVRSWLGRKVGTGVTWCAPLWIVSSLFFSGAVMAPEFAFVTALSLLAYRYAMLRERSGGEELHVLPADSGHRDLSGYSWTGAHAGVPRRSLT